MTQDVGSGTIRVKHVGSGTIGVKNVESGTFYLMWDWLFFEIICVFHVKWVC